MRVAHVITRMIIGGAQENTLYNCVGLVQEYGDEVLLVTGPSIGPEGALLEQGRAGGVRVVTVDALRRSIHPWRDVAGFRAIRRVLAEFRPDVVHTHSAKGGFLGRAAAWSLEVPAVIHTVHGAPFHEYQSPAARWLFIQLEKWAARRCHHVISVADAMTDRMVRAGVAHPEKFTTIYSGMEVEPFLSSRDWRRESRRELGLSDSDIVFGKIARLFHLKGHEYVIQAASRVIAENRKCKFLFVGDGILRQRLERQIDRAGLRSHFLFVGLVPPQRIPYYLSAMDVLVHASLREGLARTLPQALLAGMPVISFDIDGAREVVLPERTGCLVPPMDSHGLARAMLLLANDPERRGRYGEQGAALFADQFRHQEMTRRIRQVYMDVLERNRSAPQDRGG